MTVGTQLDLGALHEGGCLVPASRRAHSSTGTSALCSWHGFFFFFKAFAAKKSQKTSLPDLLAVLEADHPRHQRCPFALGTQVFCALLPSCKSVAQRLSRSQHPLKVGGRKNRGGDRGGAHGTSKKILVSWRARSRKTRHEWQGQSTSMGRLLEQIAAVSSAECV